MRLKRILILAGTHDARLLANRLVADGHDVTSSFAGVTTDPILPKGKIRRGGFGGVEGLRNYVEATETDLVVDATHPFAATISNHAALACSDILRLERPAWMPQIGDQWVKANCISDAVAALDFEARVFLTIGRKEIAPFMSRPDLSGVARMIEPPAQQLQKNWTLLLGRPPFTLESETELMIAHRISHLVTKNAGGADTVTKLEAARNLRLPVIMIARPAKPTVETYTDIDAIAVAIACR